MNSINPYVAPRERMVLGRLERQGVHDSRVVDAMRGVARLPRLRAQARPGGRLAMPVADRECGQAPVR